MDAMSTVSVVIPTWNRADLVRKVLLSLQDQTTAPAEIIVVDNGSTDETPQVVRDSGARLIALAKNEGFAAAVNEGVRNAAFEWVFILNNDVELDRDWIACALTTGGRLGVDFVTGKLLQAQAPGRIDGTWDLVSRAGCAWRCGWNSLDGPRWSETRRVRIPRLRQRCSGVVCFKKSACSTQLISPTMRMSILESGARCDMLKAVMNLGRKRPI